MESLGASYILIPRDKIQSRIRELASSIGNDYKDKNLVLMVVLKGAYVFAADLSRALWITGKRDFEIEFVGVSSYGSETSSSKNPQLSSFGIPDISGKDVLIIEDIIETGHSLLFLYEMIRKKNPSSVKSTVLLSKKGKKEVAIQPDYIGFEIDGNVWIEGYGLDSSQKSRGIPDILAKST